MPKRLANFAARSNAADVRPKSLRIAETGMRGPACENRHYVAVDLDDRRPALERVEEAVDRVTEEAVLQPCDARRGTVRPEGADSPEGALGDCSPADGRRSSAGARRGPPLGCRARCARTLRRSKRRLLRGRASRTLAAVSGASAVTAGERRDLPFATAGDPAPQARRCRHERDGDQPDQQYDAEPLDDHLPLLRMTSRHATTVASEQPEVSGLWAHLCDWAGPGPSVG